MPSGERRKCHWCGVSFIEDLTDGQASLRFLGEATGIGLGMDAVNDAKSLFGKGKKYFCSVKCKRDYEEEHGLTKEAKAEQKQADKEQRIADDKQATENLQVELLLKQNARNKKREAFWNNETNCINIANMSLGHTKEELVASMNEALNKISVLKPSGFEAIKSFFKPGNEKRQIKILKTHIEYGIMRLKSMGCDDDSIFFEEKIGIKRKEAK